MERCENGTIGVALIAFGYAYWKIAKFAIYGGTKEDEKEVINAEFISITASSTAIATIGVSSIVSAVIGKVKN